MTPAAFLASYFALRHSAYVLKAIPLPSNDPRNPREIDALTPTERLASKAMVMRDLSPYEYAACEARWSVEYRIGTDGLGLPPSGTHNSEHWARWVCRRYPEMGRFTPTAIKTLITEAERKVRLALERREETR